MKTILGVDLSLTSPALCIHRGDQFNFSNCEFFFMTKFEKYLYKHTILHGETFVDYSCDSERYSNIGQWVLDIAKFNNVDKVFIEDYSYGSVGRVFNIAENGGVLKFLLWRSFVPYEGIPPTVIKKFATGKGNADKQKMEEAFLEETKFDVRDVLGMPAKNWNPSSDLIDSYFICKYGEQHERERLETERQGAVAGVNSVGA